jgi:hypothetical protein
MAFYLCSYYWRCWMRISVNYRSVLQSNYFDQVDNKSRFSSCIWNWWRQNSPLKLVFYAAIHTGKEALLSNMKLTSISKVNIDATAASLPVSLRFICVEIDSINTKIIVLIILFFSLSRQVYILTWYLKMNVYIVHGLDKSSLKTFFCSRISPYKNVYDSLGKHDFPWLTILSLFNDKDMSDSEVVKSILTDWTSISCMMTAWHRHRIYLNSRVSTNVYLLFQVLLWRRSSYRT